MSFSNIFSNGKLVRFLWSYFVSLSEKISKISVFMAWMIYWTLKSVKLPFDGGVKSQLSWTSKLYLKTTTWSAQTGWWQWTYQNITVKKKTILTFKIDSLSLSVSELKKCYNLWWIVSANLPRNKLGNKNP